VAEAGCSRMEGPQSRSMQSQSRIKLASLQGNAIEADTYVLILKAGQQAVAGSAMTEAAAILKACTEPRADYLGVSGVLRPGFETLGWAYSGGQL
jgi:hypothetical protein